MQSYECVCIHLSIFKLSKHHPSAVEQHELQDDIITDLAVCERFGFDVEINKPLLPYITLEVMCVYMLTGTMHNSVITEDKTSDKVTKLSLEQASNQKLISSLTQDILI